MFPVRPQRGITRIFDPLRGKKTCPLSPKGGGEAHLQSLPQRGRIPYPPFYFGGEWLQSSWNRLVLGSDIILNRPHVLSSESRKLKSKTKRISHGYCLANSLDSSLKLNPINDWTNVLPVLPSTFPVNWRSKDYHFNKNLVFNRFPNTLKGIYPRRGW